MANNSLVVVPNNGIITQPTWEVREGMHDPYTERHPKPLLRDKHGGTDIQEHNPHFFGQLSDNLTSEVHRDNTKGN